MVQTKHKKSKPPRKLQTAVKKHGKQADIAQFRTQLEDLGLRIVEVTSDGNCFFRALADQLEGNEDVHKKYRDMVVQYIKLHREDFEPFIEDEVPFDDYCKSMGEDGTWAGNMELQAASLVTKSNICIHQSMSPRWYIRNFHTHEARMAHISYHDGEHYNSVRHKEDPGSGPAKIITIKVDSEISSTSDGLISAVSKSRMLSGERNIDMSSIKIVISGTGCKSLKKVEQVLLDVDGDVDAAIEYLIAEMELNENVTSDDSCGKDNSTLHGNNGRAVEDSQDVSCDGSISECASGLVHDSSTQNDNKKFPMNKQCSCGSRKKQKSCCGSSGGKSVASPSKCTRPNATKGKNEKNNKKGNDRQLHGSTILPDLTITSCQAISNWTHLRCGKQSSALSRWMFRWSIALSNTLQSNEKVRDTILCALFKWFACPIIPYAICNLSSSLSPHLAVKELTYNVFMSSQQKFIVDHLAGLLKYVDAVYAIPFNGGMGFHLETWIC